MPTDKKAQAFNKKEHVKIFHQHCYTVYRAEKNSLKILLSSAQAGPGRKVKQEQEEISRNHVPRLFLGSVNMNRAKSYTWYMYPCYNWISVSSFICRWLDDVELRTCSRFLVISS